MYHMVPRQLYLPSILYSLLPPHMFQSSASGAQNLSFFLCCILTELIFRKIIQKEV